MSNEGYLYLIERKSGNIVRVNNLHSNYKKTKRKKIIKPTGFFIGSNKIYLTNDDGKLITADLNTGKIISIIKIAGDKISQPYVSKNNLFLIKNGTIIKYN